MIHRVGSAFVLAAFLLAGLVACGVAGESSGKGGGASVSVSLIFPEGATADCATCAKAPDYVLKATLTITGDLLPAPLVQDIPLDTGTVEGTLEPGIYTFTITVVTTKFGTFTGETTMTLSPGANNPVGIKLAVNAPPTIDSLTYSPANPAPGDTVTLTAAASDPDGDPLTYGWSATGGTIGGSGPVVSFATDAGATTISVTLTVNDGHGGTDTVTKTLVIPPVTPTGLACNPGHGTLGLTWNASPGATSYKLYSSAGGAKSTTGTALADGGVKLHETRTYQVSAVNASGESPKSKSVSCIEQTGMKWTNRGFWATGKLAYGAGLFVMGDAGAASVNRVHTSPDGATWTTRALPVSGSNVTDVIWTGTQFVAVAHSGPRADRYISADGVTWALVNLITFTSVNGPSQVVGNGANTLTYYDTGLIGNYTCAGQGTAAGCGVLSVGGGGSAPAPGVWPAGGSVIVPATAGDVFVSTDNGATWARRVNAATYPDTSLQAAAFGASTYVVVGKHTLGGVAPVYTSIDSVTWTPQNSNNSSTLNDVIRAGSWFVAAGSGFSFSADGITWEAPVANPGGASPFYSLEYDGTRFVAVQQNGTVWTSP